MAKPICTGHRAADLEPGGTEEERREPDETATQPSPAPIFPPDDQPPGF